MTDSEKLVQIAALIAAVNEERGNERELAALGTTVGMIDGICKGHLEYDIETQTASLTDRGRLELPPKGSA